VLKRHIARSLNEEDGWMELEPGGETELEFETLRQILIRLNDTGQHISEVE
jgi:hypothetical protein